MNNEPEVDENAKDTESQEYNRIMSPEMFNLTMLEPMLDHTMYPTVRSFVLASVEAWKLNPILVEVAAQWKNMTNAQKADLFPPSSESGQALYWRKHCTSGQALYWRTFTPSSPTPPWLSQKGQMAEFSDKLFISSC